MLSKNKNGFVYDSFWEQWSRILVRGGGNHVHEVSIPITPIQLDIRGWEDIANINIRNEDIRQRSDIRASDNVYTHTLPDEIYDLILTNLGPSKTYLLVHANTLHFIDWVKHSKMGNNLVPLKDCMIKRNWSFSSLIESENSVVEAHMTGHLFASQYGIDIPENTIFIGGVYHKHGEEYFKTHGFYDIALETVTFKVEISTPDHYAMSSFSSRINGNWVENFKNYVNHNKHIKVETAEAVIEMISASVNNLTIYNKDK